MNERAKVATLLAAALMGCGQSAEDRSRLQVGQKVIAYSKHHDTIVVDPKDGSNYRLVPVGTSLVTARDEGEEGKPMRKILVRVEVQEPWTGEAYRNDVRPTK